MLTTTPTHTSTRSVTHIRKKKKVGLLFCIAPSLCLSFSLLSSFPLFFILWYFE
jgi:hypothetical protein